MKLKAKKNSGILIFLICAFFISCEDFSFNNLSKDFDKNFENQEFFTVSGKLSSSLISQIENTEFQNSRTAFPDFSSATRNLQYFLEAENSETGEKVEALFENNSSNFSIKLTIGKWNLNAKAILGEQTVCEGSKQVELSTENPIVSNLVIDLIEVYGGGEGTVNLTLSVGSSSKVKSVQAEWNFLQGSSTLNSSATSSKSASFNVASDGTVVINKLTSSEEKFAAGAYNLKLNFWSTTYSEQTKSGGLLLYTLEEIVNVFSGIETNTWQGNSLYFTESSGKKIISISDSMIQKFLQTSFYVGKNSAVSTNPSDSNSGTFFDPFATVQKAVDRIVELENLEHNPSYIIYVCSNVSGGADFSKLNSSLSKNSLVIDLRKSSSSSSSTNPSIQASSQVIKMPSLTSISTSTNFSLSISEINLSGGSSAANGSIVEVPKNTTLRLIDCEIKNNLVGEKGAVYVSGGNLFLGGKITITGNKTSGGNAANVYLATDKKITLDTFSLSSLRSPFDAASRIGITSQTKPSATSSKVQICAGGTSNLLPYVSSFSSDENYTIINESLGLYLAISSGNLSVKQIDDLSFELSTKQVNSNSRNLTVSAKSGGKTITVQNWNLKIYYCGVYTGKSATSSTIGIEQSWPNGTYQLFVSATYNGITYSSYFDFEKND